MKLHLLLFCIVLSLFLENGPVSGLKFAPGKAVKVDNPDGVIEVGKRTKLTCNYAISVRETVNSIHWYFSVNGYNEKVSTLHKLSVSGVYFSNIFGRKLRR